MKVSILAFGITKEILGGREVQFELSGEQTVANLLQALEGQYPKLQGLVSLKVAVNSEYAEPDWPITESDEVVLIPPVSGG
ncbi:MAG: MoaD/ThiS family protein [Bacteroidota bacterium]